MTKTKLKIKRGETMSFTIQFLPVTMETHHCKIVFVDSVVGEFQHEITGEVSLPEVTQEIKPQHIYVDQKIVHEIPVSMRNELRVAAVQKIEQKMGLKNSKGEGFAADNEVMHVTLTPPISYIQFHELFEFENKNPKVV